MVKLAGPAMSLDASGSLAGILVFSKWKGRNYARSKVTPSNPKSGLQVGFRSMFKFLAQNWAEIGASDQATWQTLADQIVASPFNAYMRDNQRRWRNFLAPSEATPAAEADTPAGLDAFSASGGAGYVDITWDLAAGSDDWGIMLFRSTSTGFTPSLANCVAVLRVASPQTTEQVYTDTPLDADTYYYDAKSFTFDGVLSALKGEINGTAT